MRLEEEVIGVVQPQTKESKWPLEAREGKAQILPLEPPEGTALLTPCFQTSDFRSFERMRLRCFKPLGLWSFVPPPPRKLIHCLTGKRDGRVL